MKERSVILGLIIIIISLIIVGRLSYVQLIDKKYKQLATRNAVKREYIIPERGYVYDRNDELLVSNLPVYDVMVTPKLLKPFDTLSFMKYTEISKKELLNRIKKARKYSYNKPSLVVSKLYKNQIALLQERIHKFPGFFIQRRAIRSYHTKSAANVLGYIREVNDRELKKDPFYLQGDLIGKAGVEKSYEKILRGKKGIKYFLSNKFNQKIGSFNNGKSDTIAETGKDLMLSIDIDLQSFGDSLLVGKRGAIIALEPKTGEILALVTAPGYPPEYLSGKNSSKHFNKLFRDKVNNPLLDRGLQGAYPPGSPFKMINGLIGLQEGVINSYTSFRCSSGFRYGKNAHMFCHCGANGRLVRLPWAITKSCNTYFSNTYLNIINKYSTPVKGIDAWNKHVESFGLGQYLHTDLPVGSKGNIPDSEFYDRYYRGEKWSATYSISNAIGQGEVLTTPIQLANVTAIIANRGFYITPHVVKKINGKKYFNPNFVKKKYTTIDAKYFEPIVEGMAQVYKTGTARYSNLKDIELCGKTGTSENKARINGKVVKLPDHSIFIAFAPKNNPKIAVAVFVENGGYGATIAAPMATLMIEKYIRGNITRTDLLERIKNINLEPVYQKKYEVE